MDQINAKFTKTTLKMNFLNGVLSVPMSYGGYVIAPGCGSGKTTVIKDIIRQRFNDGIVYAASTIKECDDMYEWLMTNVVGRVQPENNDTLKEEDIIVLHSRNEQSRYMYRWNPDDITRIRVIICTHYKLLHDDPRFMIVQNFNIMHYNPKFTNIKYSLTARMRTHSEYILPRQWIIVDEMPTCEQLKAYFSKLAKVNLLDNINESVYVDSIDEKGNPVKICIEPKLRLKGYNSRDEVMSAYDCKLKGSEADPFCNVNEENSPVPLKLRKELILDSYIENEAKNTDTYNANDIKSGYVRYSITDFIIDEMQTRVLVFDGTGDLTFGSNNERFNLKNIDYKYNSPCTYVMIPNLLTRKLKESYIINHEIEITDKLKECCKQLESIIEENEKTLIVTWKDLMLLSEGSKRSKVNITKNKYNEDFNLPTYFTEELKKMGVTKTFSIIHYQSGMDKATNDYRDYDTIVFLGRFQVPNSVITEFNEIYGADTNIHRYTMYQLVQAICRTRIRNHRGEPINVYFTDDWDSDIVNSVIIYLGNQVITNRSLLSGVNDNRNLRMCLGNSMVTNCTPSPNKKLFIKKWESVIEKLDKTLLPGLINIINSNNPLSVKTYNVTLDEISSIIPMKIKEVRSYGPLITYLKRFGVDLVITSNRSKLS